MYQKSTFYNILRQVKNVEKCYFLKYLSLLAILKILQILSKNGLIFNIKVLKFRKIADFTTKIRKIKVLSHFMRLVSH